MTEPQITVKPYYHTGSVETPFLGGCTITVSRMEDRAAPKDVFFGSIQCKGEEVYNCSGPDGNIVALLCHGWVVIHGHNTEATCYPPITTTTNNNTISSTDC
jgi:hypothetical protein